MRFCVRQKQDTDDAEKSTISHMVFMHSKQQYLYNKKRRPNRKHRYGVSQIPSEG